MQCTKIVQNYLSDFLRMHESGLSEFRKTALQFHTHVEQFVCKVQTQLLSEAFYIWERVLNQFYW